MWPRGKKETEVRFVPQKKTAETQIKRVASESAQDFQKSPEDEPEVIGTAESGKKGSRDDDEISSAVPGVTIHNV